MVGFRLLGRQITNATTALNALDTMINAHHTHHNSKGLQPSLIVSGTFMKGLGVKSSEKSICQITAPPTMKPDSKIKNVISLPIVLMASARRFLVNKIGIQTNRQIKPFHKTKFISGS
jgi:hypothetical protein